MYQRILEMDKARKVTKGVGGLGSTTHYQKISPPPSPLDLPIGYTSPPVPLVRYSEGNKLLNDVPVVVIIPQQLELNTK